MKEQKFLEIINKTLSNNSYLGDDCAYLKELGIVVTQDSFVEDIHFKKEFSCAYDIAHKAICANLSDIFASGAKAAYITISLSLPKNTDENFVKDFYRACKDLSEKFGFEVIGGDITGSEKIFISICAIGTTKNRNISSRANAKIGDLVVVTGEHGASRAGLFMLKHSIKSPYKFIKEHLTPQINNDFSKNISTNTQNPYAMMDTSDGLADALLKISQSSKVEINIDFDKIPYDKDLEKLAFDNKKDYKDWVFYGGEDYKLVACVNEKDLKNIKSDYTIIGKVISQNEKGLVKVNFGNEVKELNFEKTFNHFD